MLIFSMFVKLTSLIFDSILFSVIRIYEKNCGSLPAPLPELERQLPGFLPQMVMILIITGRRMELLDELG